MGASPAKHITFLFQMHHTFVGIPVYRIKLVKEVQGHFLTALVLLENHRTSLWDQNMHLTLLNCFLSKYFSKQVKVIFMA